jgi:hypothetical protein
VARTVAHVGLIDWGFLVAVAGGRLGFGLQESCVHTGNVASFATCEVHAGGGTKGTRRSIAVLIEKGNYINVAGVGRGN